MSTIAVTNVKHPSAVDPAIVLDADGGVSVAGMGLVHVATESFSAVSSVIIDDCFSATYDNYYVNLSFTQSTDSGLSIRLRAAGTDLSSAVYQWARIFNASNGGSITGSSQTNGSLLELFGNAVKNGSNEISINSPFLTNETLFSNQITTLSNATVNYNALMSGGVNNTLSYDGFTIITSSGTITGTIRVYGYANS